MGAVISGILGFDLEKGIWELGKKKKLSLITTCDGAAICLEGENHACSLGTEPGVHVRYRFWGIGRDAVDWIFLMDWVQDSWSSWCIPGVLHCWTSSWLCNWTKFNGSYPPKSESWHSDKVSGNCLRLSQRLDFPIHVSRSVFRNS